jgi:diacylglycerol kinase family enzyme
VLPRCEAQAIDVGTVGSEPFLMGATGGLDAAVMSWQDGELKKLLGRGALVGATFRQWWSYDYPTIELRVDGRRERVSYFAACNIPYYGGGVRMAPEADFRDGLLDLVLFRGSGRLETLALGRDLLLGRHLRRSDVELRRVEEIELLGPPGVRMQLDGDLPVVEPPVRIGVAEEKLWVLMPAG